MSRMLGLSLSLLLASPLFASTHTAVSCNQADVDAALLTAKNDPDPRPVVSFPANGSCPSTVVNIPRTLDLFGNGTAFATVNIGNTSSRATGFTVTNEATSFDAPLVL